MSTPAEKAALAAEFSLSPAEIQHELSHPGQSKESSILAAIGTCSALATIAILTRIWVRRSSKNRFMADDYNILVAFIFSWASFVAIYYQTHGGALGWHLLVLTPERVRIDPITLYFNSINLILCSMFTQISFLFLYKRVFTLYQRWFRNTLYGIATLTLTVNISCLLAHIFQCSPIQKAWIFGAPGKCIQHRKLFIIHGALTLVIDVAIVVAPMPLIWALHASFAYRAAVCGMFLLGSLVCVINVIKIHYLTYFPKGDVTYNDIGSTTWAHAQLCLGVVGACLPLFRPILRTLNVILSTKTHSTATKTTMEDRSTRNTKPSAGDSYKTLEGKEPSLTESDIALVPREQWTATTSFPGQSSGVHTESIVKAGSPLPRDVERGLSINEIGVVREVDVTSS